MNRNLSSECGGRLDHDKAEIVRWGFELRHHFSHPAGRVAFSLGKTYSVLRVSHLVVRDACIANEMTRLQYSRAFGHQAKS